MTFGPATQQTVVTTTTTTTVSLPPLIMNPPKDLMERDPKQYPLVFTPTPRSIKRFAFDVHGRPTTFHEAEDAEETMRQHRKVQAKIQRHNGSLTYEEAREKKLIARLSLPRSFRPWGRRGKGSKSKVVSLTVV
jgi:F-box and WD-40 domain protein CDC4